jgi:hypothetical protein
VLVNLMVTSLVQCCSQFNDNLFSVTFNLMITCSVLQSIKWWLVQYYSQFNDNLFSVTVNLMIHPTVIMWPNPIKVFNLVCSNRHKAYCNTEQVTIKLTVTLKKSSLNWLKLSVTVNLMVTYSVLVNLMITCSVLVNLMVTSSVLLLI